MVSGTGEKMTVTTTCQKANAARSIILTFGFPIEPRITGNSEA